MKTKLIPFALILAGLTACGTASDISKDNPNYFGATLKNGVITGSYNPAGYDAQLVRNQIRNLCVSREIGSYGQSAPREGVISFQAKCAGPARYRTAFMEVERMSNGNFSVEIIGS